MLVALEGIDGAGKRTQAELLAARARAEGLAVEVLAFPRYGETFFSAAVRELLQGGFGHDNDVRLVGLLFAGDRLESRSLIEQTLAAADLVVVDRYVASNLAYQAARVGIAGAAPVVSWLEAVEHEVYGLPRPQLTLLYDLPVALAVERLAARVPAGGRPSGDLYEADHEFLDACRGAYLALAADRPDWSVIELVDAAGPRSVEAIGEQGWAALKLQLER